MCALWRSLGEIRVLVRPPSYTFWCQQHRGRSLELLDRLLLELELLQESRSIGKMFLFPFFLKESPPTPPLSFFALVIDRLFGAVIGWTGLNWNRRNRLECKGVSFFFGYWFLTLKECVSNLLRQRTPTFYILEAFQLAYNSEPRFLY